MNVHPQAIHLKPLYDAPASAGDRTRNGAAATQVAVDKVLKGFNKQQKKVETKITLPNSTDLEIVICLDPKTELFGGF